MKIKKGMEKGKELEQMEVQPVQQETLTEVG